jgi:hypothetical protein
VDLKIIMGFSVDWAEKSPSIRWKAGRDGKGAKGLVTGERCYSATETDTAAGVCILISVLMYILSGGD